VTAGAARGVTVVIPTADRDALLARALAAVAGAARELDEPVEAIVVDDRPATRAPEPDAQVVDGLSVRTVRTGDADVHGPAAARNLGASLARYDLIAFTDDDACCDSRWLAVGVARLRSDPSIAGVEGAVRVGGGGGDIDPVRARIVMNVRGGAYLTASMFVRAAALRAVGGFRRLRADPTGWAVPYREDTDLALRIIRDVGPIPFVPEAFVLHPAEAVDTRRLLRLARYFVVDGAFARLHPGAVPPLWRRPLARLRIRLAVAVTLIMPALAYRRTRTPAALIILALGAAVSAQFEVEVRAAGVRRGRVATLRDTIRRLPRSLLWSLAAGSARLQGEAMVGLGLIEVAGDGGRGRPEALPSRARDPR